MTSFELISYIFAAAFFQLSVFGTLAFYRHWQVYQTMKSNLSEFAPELSCEPIVEDYSPDIIDEKQSVWTGLRKFRIDKKVFEDESQSICSFYLVPVDAQPLPIFKPGQFLTFELAVTDPVSKEGKKVIRCYSLSDRPGLDHYRVSIKRVLPPAGSQNLPTGLASNFFHDNVQQGEVLDVRSPNGHFFMEASNRPVVLIAGGIGITPMLSMLNTYLDTKNLREIWLFYGVRNSTDQAMKMHLEALAKEHSNFRLYICYSKPQQKDNLGIDYQHKGRVDISLLRLTLPLKPFQFYICGPRPMMETIVPALDEWGVPKENIHFEAFGPASLSKSAFKKPLKEGGKIDSPPVTVTFSGSGKSIPWDENSNSLLDFAEENDIDVESGCRAGGCGACQTTIEQGEVEYIQAPDFDPDPGCCLLCVSRPTRDLVLKI
ncbi:oxidoreductase FAD/NAD(P)-binding domain-containing protein [Terasakiella brassicae]|jgi:ferredoxin-NADP reductase|uniref:nitric oxide dioxygenase n=1 Tax=Terasakiella brassicae TaxID=1634917 RepID=A0A917FFK4_9PROT|nr:2Fe-2S iron-sulfur cluster-binding protein [Terasakiella brassicae]GGF76575.1 oxidoreductase FAD/NAD(P)-binding domain-containing protein [Terasakiella brassicae]